MVMRSPVALRSRAFSLSEREKEEAARVEDRLAGTTCHATLMEVAVTNFRQRLTGRQCSGTIPCHAGYDCGPPVGPTPADLGEWSPPTLNRSPALLYGAFVVWNSPCPALAPRAAEARHKPCGRLFLLRSPVSLALLVSACNQPNYCPHD